jgi:hypothetical protein
MPARKEIVEDHAAEAKRILHEDRVSPNVVRIEKRLLNGKLWALYYANDRDRGLLNLLEGMRLLRDLEQEEKDAENHKAMLRAFGPAETPREKGYARLCRAAADALPASFRKAVEALEKVRTDEELDAAQTPSLLDVHAWRHGGSAEDALALARVRKLTSDMWRRKTIPMQALLDALNGPAAQGEKGH